MTPLPSTPQERITRIIDSIAGDHEIVRMDIVWLLARLEIMEKALREIDRESLECGETATTENYTLNKFLNIGAIARSALYHD
jgi:hypothetical protein